MQTLRLFCTFIGINTLFLFTITITPRFLRITWIRLIHLSLEIRKIMPASSSLLISFLITSISKRLSLFCCYLTSLAHSSSKMWCMHVEGLIPLMLVSVHPMTYLLVLKIANNLSFWFGCKFFAMITDSYIFSTRKAYFKWLRRGLSSNSSGYMKDKSILVECWMLNFYNFGFNYINEFWF